MSWEHFAITQSGTCQLTNTQTHTVVSANYERGILSTGKSRVFWGYQITLRLENVNVTGKSQGYVETFTLALQDLNEKLAPHNLRLNVAGNHSSYRESRMSCGSGYGYLAGHQQAVDIMSYCAPENTV